MNKLYPFILLVALSFGMHVSTSAQQRNILIEKYSATWCGYCPAATLDMEAYMDSNIRIIGMSTHYFDAMQIADGKTVTEAYVEAFPGSTIDRVKFLDEEKINVFYQDWHSHIQARLNTPSMVNVSGEVVNYNPTTGELEISITVDAVASYTGDLRVNCYVLENNVTGGSDYNQRNYYFNNDPSSPLYQAGDPMLNYVHNHVLRAMLGGPWGSTGVVAATINNGETFYKTYNTTVDAGWDVNELRFIAVVQHYDGDVNKREIENVSSFDMGTWTGINSQKNNSDNLHVFPNPSIEGVFYITSSNDLINSKLNVYDMFGNEVGVTFIQSSNNQIQVRLNEEASKGIYFLTWENQANKGVVRLVKQ